MSQSSASAIPAASPTVARRAPVLSQTHLFAAILLCFLPLLALHFRQLWLYEHYQYFPWILIAFPFLISRNRQQPPQPRTGNGRWAWVLMGCGLGLLALAVIAWSPNLAAVAFVITAGGILGWFYHTGYLARFIPLWFVLLFLVKLPLNIDVDLIFWLQGITSQMASRLLDFLGINHFLAGHNIRIASVDFAVEEACSGIQSLFSLLAMTALILAFYRRSLIHSVLLLLGAIFWACMINVLRVATLVTAYERFGIDLSADRPHEMLGLVLFALAVGLMISTDRLLLFFTADDTMEGDDDEIEHFRTLDSAQPEALPEPKPVSTVAEKAPSDTVSTAALPVPRKFGGLLLGSFLMLAFVQVGILILTSRGLSSIDPDDPRLANLFSESTLPAQLGDWTRTGFDAESRSLTNYQGRHTAKWIYESDKGQVVIAVDYPFLGWHELTGCYVAEGCNVDQREVVASDNAVHASLTMPSGSKSRLIFSEFTNDGQSLLPLGNDAGTLAYWKSRLQSAVLRQVASFKSNQSSFQVQLLHRSDRPQTGEELDGELAELQRSSAKAIAAVVQEATSK